MTLVVAITTTEATLTISLSKVYCPYCGCRTEFRYADGMDRSFCILCDRILYENPVPATCVVVRDINRILLVKRRFPPSAGEWCLPGGFLELKEQPVTGALRELEEETGLKGCITRFLGAIATPGSIYSGLLILGYTAEVLGGRLNPGDDALKADWFAPSAFPRVAFDSHAEFIRRALQSDFAKADII